jgi:hypothetical protein
VKRSLKAYISLFTAMCFLLCTVGIFTAAAETGTDNELIETGYIFDDAVDINPETNSNIRASSNLSAQNWGDFDDKSFFGMNGGSSGDDTFVIVQTPPERYFNYFSVNTYRYDGVKEDYGIYISADDNYYSPLSVSFSSAQSGHGGFARCTYTSAVMPAGMRYIKIVFPQDKENWKLMVSSFSIGWTSSPTGESAEQIPVSAADNHIRTRVIDDASALEGDATNIISSVNVKTARFNGLTDESVIQPSLSSAQVGECYIVLKAPQGTNITDITVTSEH